MAFGGATQVAQLYAKLGADVSDFNREMKSSHSALEKMGSAVTTFAKVGVATAVAGLGAMAAGMTSALKASAQFDKQISASAAVLNATAEEMKKLDSLALQLGKDTQFSASEAAEAITMLGQNGLNATQILGGAAKATVDLAAAAGTDLSTAADVASTAMTLFGIKAENMGKAVDGISGVTNASRFAINDYALALAAGGSVASQLGVSFDDFNTAIAATASSFSSGSDAGTSFKTFLQRLVPVSEPAAEALKELGIITKEGKNQFFDATGKLKSFDQIAQILQNSMAGLSDEMKSSLLFDAFGTDAARMALALGSVGAGGINATQGIIQATSAAEQARIRMDNLAGDVEQATGSFDTLKIALGKAFTPLARKGVQGITGFLNRLIEMDFSPLVRRVEAIASAFQVAFAGVGNIFDRLGKLGGLDTADAFLELTSIFTDWAGGVWKLVKPLLLRFWSSIEQWVTDPVRRSKILNALQRTWNGFVNWAKGLWSGIKPALDAMWQSLLTWSTDPMRGNKLSGNVLAMVQGLWRWAKGLWGIISPDLGRLWTSLTDWVGDSIKSGALLKGAGALFAGLWQWAEDIWNGTEGSEGLSTKLGRLWTSLTSWVTDSTKRQQLLNAIANTWTSFTDWAGSVWTAVSPVLAGFWTSLTSWVTDSNKRQQLWEAIVNSWTSFTGWAGSVWGAVSPVLGGMWTELTSWVTDPAKRQQLLTNISDTWTSFTDWAGKVWGWLSPHLSAAWTSITSWVTDPVKRQELFDAVSNAWTSFTDWAAKVWGWASPKLAQFWTDLTSWVTNPQKRTELLNTLGSAWTSFTDWAGALWNGTAPNPGVKGKLLSLWGELTSWVTNPEKRAQLLTAISNTWTSFVDWANGIWLGADGKSGLRSKLAALWGNIDAWITTNVPAVKPWTDAFVSVATASEGQWAISFPKMAQSVADLGKTVGSELPLIGKAFGDLWKTLFGDASPMGSGAPNYVKQLEEFVAATTFYIGTLIKQFRLFTEVVAISAQMFKAFFAGDFATVQAKLAEGAAKWAEFGQATGAQWQQFMGGMGNMFGPTGGGSSGSGNSSGGTQLPPGAPSIPAGGRAETMTDVNGNRYAVIYDANGVVIWTGPAYAKGGLVSGSGMALVGEQGPELVNLPGGSHVYNADQTAAMMGGSTQHIVLEVRGESNLPMDRVKLKELARMLMGEMQLRGMRVVMN